MIGRTIDHGNKSIPIDTVFIHSIVQLSHITVFPNEFANIRATLTHRNTISFNNIENEIGIKTLLKIMEKQIPR